MSSHIKKLYKPSLLFS